MRLIAIVSDFYSQNPIITIALTITCLLLVALAVLLICCLRRRRIRQGIQSSKNKNTIELNEEQFKDNIQYIKRGEVTDKPADSNAIENNTKDKKQRYLQFNDEEFVEGVPKRAN